MKAARLRPLRGERALLVTDGADIAWVTGLRLDGFWVLMVKGKPVVLATPLSAGQLSRLLPRQRIVTGPSLTEALRAACRSFRLSSLALDFDRVTHAAALAIASFVRISPPSRTIVSLRIVKDSAEIALIRRSCRLAAAAVARARRTLRPGMTERAVAAAIDVFFAARGARPAFPTIVAAGPNSANPHHISSYRKIKENDVVLIDLGASLNGYCSDLTRTYLLGTITDFQRNAFQLVARARQAAISVVRAGRKAESVDAAARGCITQAGHGDRFIHSTGHGLGLEVHEGPRVGPGARTVLAPGMVVTVEPGVYFNGRFGVRIEDTVLVTSKGCEVLTR